MTESQFSSVHNSTFNRNETIKSNDTVSRKSHIGKGSKHAKSVIVYNGKDNLDNKFD